MEDPSSPGKTVFKVAGQIKVKARRVGTSDAFYPFKFEFTPKPVDNIVSFNDRSKMEWRLVDGKIVRVGRR